MNYETFFNISIAIIDYVDYNRAAFIDFGHCVRYNLITDTDVDYFSELRRIYLRSRYCKKGYEQYLRPEILACAIIIIRYPNESFENIKTEKTKIKYMIPNAVQIVNGEHVILSKRSCTLLDKAKTLNRFMMEI